MRRKTPRPQSLYRAYPKVGKRYFRRPTEAQAENSFRIPFLPFSKVSLVLFFQNNEAFLNDRIKIRVFQKNPSEFESSVWWRSAANVWVRYDRFTAVAESAAKAAELACQTPQWFEYESNRRLALTEIFRSVVFVGELGAHKTYPKLWVGSVPYHMEPLRWFHMFGK